MARRMLVVARHKPIEALRIAAGLTLADVEVQVLALGPLPEGEEAQVQLEALEFSDVHPRQLTAADRDGWAEVAQSIVDSDGVYLL